MTRLNDDNMQSIRNQYKDNEDFLIKNIGKSFLDIGSHATNKTYNKKELKDLKVACIPITSGLGEISNFSKMISVILQECCGISAFVTKSKDISGVQEEYDEKADIIFLADDDTFSAFHLKKNLYVDNGEATGRGFAAALELAAGSLVGKEVLVLGAGDVGCAGATYLSEREAHVKLYDKNRDKVSAYTRKHTGVQMLSKWEDRPWDYILEATNKPDIIKANHITNQTILSAPGVPFGAEDTVVRECKLVIHNLLELGVVTMLCGVG